VPAGEGAFSEKNTIVFASGPFTGTPIWGCGRAHAAAISPQTGLFGDSNFGGDFASMLKATGFDAVVIIGKASSPVYLKIDERGATCEKADALWGMTTTKAHEKIREIEGNDVESAVIGPAGEHRVSFASIIASGARISAAGRMGLGAVMGSKNLKAIAVRGNAKTDIAQGELLLQFLKNRLPVLRDQTRELTELGTPVLVKIINDRGMLASRNNTREVFPEWDKISGERMVREFKQKNIACRRCPVACGKIVSVPSGEFGGKNVKMPEFESIYALATMCDSSDIASLFNTNTLCDELGLDTISMGVTLAFAAECLEKSLADETLFGTKNLFGNGEALFRLIYDTAYRRGAGELLSLGSEKMAETLGNNAYQYLYSVKGLEIAGHSARGIRTMGLAYATSTRGGSHHDARPRYPQPDFDMSADDVAKYCAESQNFTALGDSLVMCRFTMERGFGRLINESLLEAFNLVTGWHFSMEDLSNAGARVYTLERLINCARGVSRLNDTLPFRVMHEPIPDGPAQGRFVPKETLDAQLDCYYALRGWDANGVPTEKTIHTLQLEE
jgi:aldehyde:ferredoxin oxidoreductase